MRLEQHQNLSRDGPIFGKQRKQSVNGTSQRHGNDNTKLQIHYDVAAAYPSHIDESQRFIRPADQQNHRKVRRGSSPSHIIATISFSERE